MPKTVVIDEVIVTLRVPAALPDVEAETVRRALLAPGFLGRLRRAVAAALAETPELNAVRVSVGR